MKPPIEHVRVSVRGKETLIRIKRNTGLQHWNEICRVALCRSLANPAPPSSPEKINDSSIEMDWKTFAGHLHNELAALIIYRAKMDKARITGKEERSDYFRAHLERGISSLQDIKNHYDLLTNTST